MRTLTEITTERAALRARRDTVRLDLEALDRAAGEAALDSGQSVRFDNLVKGAERLDADLARLDDEQRDMIRVASEDPSRVEETFDRRDDDRRDAATPPHIRAGHEAGLRTIERFKSDLTPDAGDRLDTLIRKRDPQSLGGRYIAAVGDPAYFTAFAKMVADPTTGHLRFSPAEVEAVRTVGQVEAERAMAIGATTTGGFGVPFQVDPSIMISGTGVLNPLRSISRVETTLEGTWKGVSADQVAATYLAEAAEVADASPTLAQPTIKSERGAAWVPFSIEVQQDYQSLLAQLGNLLADARDNLDATMFLTGSGTNQPVGLLTIGTAGALTTAQRIYTAGSTAFAVGDPWLLKTGIAPRFANNVTVLGGPATFDTIYRFTGGNAAEPPILPTREGACFGRPKAEMSTMDTGTAAGKKILVAGDFSQFVIADRLGFSVELVPHVFGTNHIPTGQRGLVAFWRTGVGAVIPNAFRYLEVKA